MSGISYNQFYSLPQWTPYSQQSFPLIQQQYGQNTLIPYPQEYAYTNALLANQSKELQVQSVPDQPTRRKRASKPKVRTGCRTCKIRRVKCDERKPACLRCTSTGRKCDGYEFPRKEVEARNVIKNPDPPLPLPPSRRGVVEKTLPTPQIFVAHPETSALNTAFGGTTQERRAFHRFKYRTVPALCGGSETEFWNELVLSASLTEPVIRDAVIALGTLHEDYESRGGKYNEGVVASASYLEAGLLYGRAIQHLYQRIDTIAGETANLAVIASILFACFEVLRRNNMAAVLHYQNGMRQLMKQMNERTQPQLESGNQMNEKRPLVRVSPQDDLDRMLRVFARYDVHTATYSKIKTEKLGVSLPKMPLNDVGLTEVRRYLDNLLISVYQMVKSDLSMFRYWKSDEVASVWLEKRDEAVTTFQGWLDALEKSIPSDAITLRNHGITTSKSILGVILQIKIAMIMLRTCIDCGPETSFDKFEPDFDEMVSRVENITQILGLSEAEPLQREQVPFSMELGFVHPLFFIAWKCRDWNIRRRAITQLRKCGKECAWEGPIMAVMAQRIAEIEEEGLLPGDFVPEECRIHDITKVVDCDERQVRAELRLAQDSTWKRWTTLREVVSF